jgi:hypothetical protein
MEKCYDCIMNNLAGPYACTGCTGIDDADAMDSCMACIQNSNVTAEGEAYATCITCASASGSDTQVRGAQGWFCACQECWPLSVLMSALPCLVSPPVLQADCIQCVERNAPLASQCGLCSALALVDASGESELVSDCFICVTRANTTSAAVGCSSSS